MKNFRWNEKDVLYVGDRSIAYIHSRDSFVTPAKNFRYSGKNLITGKDTPLFDNKEDVKRYIETTIYDSISKHVEVLRQNLHEVEEILGKIVD